MGRGGHARQREGGGAGEGRRAPFRGGRGGGGRRDGTGGGVGGSGGRGVAAVFIMGVVLLCEVCSHLKPLIQTPNLNPYHPVLITGVVLLYQIRPEANRHIWSYSGFSRSKNIYIKYYSGFSRSK